MEKETVYLKVEQKIEVHNKNIKLEDIGKIYCRDKRIEKELNQTEFYKITAKENQNYVFSILKVIETIEKRYPHVKVINVGETDFILSYMEPKKQKRWLEWSKVAIISAIILVGSAFSIMTFNTDVSVSDVFDKSYELFIGKGAKSNGVVEIAYSIGLPIGICVFFNHFSRKAIQEDPTPLQVEMRLYEEDANKAVIKNAEREGKSIDAN